ncbi:MAG TPA: hypothetical protein VF069_16165 [Streptosporangiaceae bacterium]
MNTRLTTTAIAGWLFADLLLAFSTVALGTQDPPPQPAVTPSPTRPARLALERRFVEVDLAVDPDAAKRGDRSAVEAIRRAVRKKGDRLAGRKAGIVLTFGAELDGAEAFAHNVNKLLHEVDGQLFPSDLATRDFQLIHTSGGKIRLDIYLFYKD